MRESNTYTVESSEFRVQSSEFKVKLSSGRHPLFFLFSPWGRCLQDRGVKLDSGSHSINTRTFEEQKENVEYRIRNIECRSEEKKLEAGSREFKVQSSKFWVELSLERHPELDSGSHLIDTKIFVEMEENIQYSINNNECKSEERKMEAGRWKFRAEPLLVRHPLFFLFSPWGRCLQDRGVKLDSGSYNQKRGLRFERNPRCAGDCFVPRNNDNSIRQRMDANNIKNTPLLFLSPSGGNPKGKRDFKNYKNSFSFLFFSSFPLRGKSRREKGLRGLFYLN